jgi:hypothetical protein
MEVMIDIEATDIESALDKIAMILRFPAQHFKEFKLFDVEITEDVEEF